MCTCIHVYGCYAPGFITDCNLSFYNLQQILFSFRSKTAVLTDERIKTMNEIISGIRVIKMYTWEEPFAKLVADIRRSVLETGSQDKPYINLLYGRVSQGLGTSKYEFDWLKSILATA